MSVLKRLLVLLFDLRNLIILHNKINSIYRHLDKKAEIHRNDLIRHRRIFKSLDSISSTKWYKVYTSVSGINDPNYISEYLYYTRVEPRLNHRGMSEAFCDKNLYHKYIDHNLLPRVFLRNIQGVFYDGRYNYISLGNFKDFIPKETQKLVYKEALDTGGGRNIDIFLKNGDCFFNRNGKELNEDFLLHYSRKNYLIQEYIVQAPYFNQFNTSSVNTIRLLTYRSIISNKIIPLQAVLRIGKSGHIVDNQASGGYVCGVNQDGTLKSFAIDKMGKRYTEVNDQRLNKMKAVFHFEEICQAGIELASLFPYHRLLGFDFAVDYQGQIRLIEINNRNNEINFYQMTNGPLFREYTLELINNLYTIPRSFCVDYEVIYSSK